VAAPRGVVSRTEDHFCSSPVKKLNSMTAQNPILQNAVQPKKKYGFLHYVLMTFYILAGSTAVAAFLFDCLTKMPQPSTQKITQNNENISSTPANKTLDDISAYVEAQDYVKQALKSPSTAKFPGTDFLVHHFGDNEYEVVSYVDSQNSFGAMIRSNWNVQFQMVNNNQQKKLKQLAINGNVIYPVEKSKAYQDQKKIQQQSNELLKEIEGMQSQLESLK
jgi:hypothetical protein